MYIGSLKRRLTLLTLLPVALFLVSAGFLSFLYARNIMLAEWREAAIAKLQRAGHHITMRLNRPMEWVEIFHTTGGERGGPLIQGWILKRIEELEGVEAVTIMWTDNGKREGHQHRSGGGMMRPDRMRQPVAETAMSFSRGGIAQVTGPRYNAHQNEQTVSLISELLNDAGELVGSIAISLRFDHLLQDVLSLGWWQSDMACLVDQDGQYLAHTAAFMTGRSRLGEDGNTLELAILEEMKHKPFGTILGPGHPAKEVAGFCRIEMSPWTIVLFAPGEKILAPIVRYRAYYALGTIVCILFVVLLVRLDTRRMIRSLIAVSRSAKKVARGEYGEPLKVDRSDEIGQLIQSFNVMVAGLKDRDFIVNTFGRYVDPEIARDLLQRPEASRLGGKKRQVAILMADIRGFTPLSESLSPDKIILFLNRYLAHIISVVQKHRGIIVDFFGDAILAFFDPFEGPVQPAVGQALECAFEMRHGMGPFNQAMKEAGLPELSMGIGIHIGEVVVGNIGSETRAKYGIVGSPVNITQRIQSEAGPGEVIISEAVYRHANQKVRIERRFSARLKGVSGEMILYTADAAAEAQQLHRA